MNDSLQPVPRPTLWKRLRWLFLGLLVIALTGYAGVLSYLYANQRHLLYLNRHEIETPDIRGVPIEDVRIATPDGETLQAWYAPPQAGKPVFLFFHGQGAKLEQGKARYIRIHAEGSGFLALAYRGFSQSTGTPSEQGLFTDGLAAYDWLRAKGFSPANIVIHGHSLGSGVATYVAAHRPARALILEAPFTAASDVGAKRYPYIPVAWLMRDHFDNVERIKDVHMPVLVAHGTADHTIPFQQGRAVYDAANAPKRFVAMPGSDHSTLVRDGVYHAYWSFLGLPDTETTPLHTK